MLHPIPPGIAWGCRCTCIPLRADDEADRQALVRQQNKVAALEGQLAGLKVGGGDSASGTLKSHCLACIFLQDAYWFLAGMV